MKRNLLISMLCSLFILLWIYAAGSKLIDYDLFQDQLFRQPLPGWSVPILGWALPVVELGTAVVLCFQRTRKIGLLLSLVLMSCFTIYVGLVLSHAFGEIPCACGGIFQSLKWPGHLIFNIIFTTIAAVGVYLSNQKKANINISSSIAQRAIE